MAPPASKTIGDWRKGGRKSRAVRVGADRSGRGLGFGNSLIVFGARAKVASVSCTIRARMEFQIG